MISLRHVLWPGLVVLALAGCYTQIHPPGYEPTLDRSPPVAQSLQDERELYVYHYHFDAYNAYDPFDPYGFRYRDPWRLQSSYYPSYWYYSDPYYSPYLDAVRDSWRWFGGAVIWSPAGVIVDSRWLPDRDLVPTTSARPHIRRSGFEGLPVPASEVRQAEPVTTYTAPSTPPPSPPPQQATKQTEQSQEKKKDEEKSQEEKRDEKRDEQRRRDGMR